MINLIKHWKVGRQKIYKKTTRGKSWRTGNCKNLIELAAEKKRK